MNKYFYKTFRLLFICSHRKKTFVKNIKKVTGQPAYQCSHNHFIEGFTCEASLTSSTFSRLASLAYEAELARV